MKRLEKGGKGDDWEEDGQHPFEGEEISGLSDQVNHLLKRGSVYAVYCTM